MMKHWLTACALLAMMVICPMGLAHAKPADLPSPDQIECGEPETPAKGNLSIEFGITNKGIVFKVGVAAANPEGTPTIDAVTPAFLEQWLLHMSDVLAQPGRATSLPAIAGSLPFVRFLGKAEAANNATPTGNRTEERKARRLFEQAEIQQRLGEFEAARVFYQQVHLMSPTSRLGRLAIERLTEIENSLQSGTEEQGEPPVDHQMLFQEIRERTVPLGLVHLAY